MREASAERTAMKPWAIAAAILVASALAGFGVQDLLAQPSVQGQWRTLSLLMPINPVHLAVTHDGNVLIVPLGVTFRTR